MEGPFIKFEVGTGDRELAESDGIKVDFAKLQEMLSEHPDASVILQKFSAEDLQALEKDLVSVSANVSFESLIKMREGRVHVEVDWQSVAELMDKWKAIDVTPHEDQFEAQQRRFALAKKIAALLEQA